MQQLLDSTVKKSKLYLHFSSHFLSKANESQKRKYATLLYGCYKALGKTEKRKEFIFRIFNTLDIKFKKIESEDDIVNIINTFNFKNYGKFFLIDLLILASLGDLDEHAKELIKRFMTYLNLTPESAENIVGLVKYILSDKDWFHYTENIKNIITPYYKVKGESKEKDKIFLNCTVEFSEASPLNIEDANFLYFINCKIISPQIEIKNSEFIKIINCKVYEKFSVNSYIKISGVYSLEITNNRVINLKNPENLIKISNIQYLNASDNRYKIFSEDFDLKL